MPTIKEKVAMNLYIWRILGKGKGRGNYKINYNAKNI